jgi:hypothetical protein
MQYGQDAIESEGAVVGQRWRWDDCPFLRWATSNNLREGTVHNFVQAPYHLDHHLVDGPDQRLTATTHKHK